MRDFRELNQQVNEVKRMLNSFIQKLTAQVEKLWRYAFLTFLKEFHGRSPSQYCGFRSLITNQDLIPDTVLLCDAVFPICQDSGQSTLGLVFAMNQLDLLRFFRY